MTSLRRQYFLSFAALGSVMPLVTVFMREQGGFDYLQIGLAMALMGVPTLCSPALITLLADRKLDTRRILATACGCSALVLGTMYFSHRIGPTMLLFFLHGLASVAMLPLQDGYFFSLAERRRRLGEPEVEYPTVRIWGTMGYCLPSLLLYYPLMRGAEPRVILPCAVFFCLLSLANSFTLERIERPAAAGASRLPSGQALAAIFAPNARWLCIGLFFAYLGSVCYYAFIGNYLDEVVRVPRHHIALIINLGVVIEVGCTLLMPWLQRRIRLKGIMVLGLACMVARMLLLAFFPTPLVAVLAQLGHGFEVLALFVGPVMFLNRLAGDEFRNSIQGVFTMAITGTARVLGGLSAGFLASGFGLTKNLLFGSCFSTLAFLVIAFLFSRIPPRDPSGKGFPSPPSLT
jgi:predicted MFS family arabinose efflux permease